MKKLLCRIIRIISSLLIVCLVLSFAGILCNHPNDRVEKTVDSFYCEEKNTLDYVVLGSSAAQCAIFPAVIYKESELMGNDLCVDGCNSNIYLSMLKELLSYQKDIILIVDLDGFNYLKENKGYNSPGFWIDSMKKNKNWKETIKKVESENTVEHYFPILKYHKNIMIFYAKMNYLQNTFSKNQPDIMKGANYLNQERLTEEQMENLIMFDNQNVFDIKIPSDRETLLIEFLDYCKSNSVRDVIFCDFPKAYCDDEKYNNIMLFEQRSEYCKKIISQYGYRYINFNDNYYDCGIDKNDFADSYHLKYTGAIKISEYIATYLKNEYTFEEKSQEIIDSWEKSTAQAYNKYKM